MASLLIQELELQKRLSAQAQEELNFLWTREKAVEALLTIIEEGNATATLNAVKQLNAMYGYSDIKPIEADNAKEGAIKSIELAIVTSDKNGDKEKEKSKE